MLLSPLITPHKLKTVYTTEFMIKLLLRTGVQILVCHDPLTYGDRKYEVQQWRTVDTL